MNVAPDFNLRAISIKKKDILLILYIDWSCVYLSIYLFGVCVLVFCVTDTNLYTRICNNLVNQCNINLRRLMQEHLLQELGEVYIYLFYVSLRWWHGWSGGRGVSSAAEDQEWCFLHASSEEVKDTHCQGPAALAHTQVLNQRTLLQPQGTINRTHPWANINVSRPWHTCRCSGAEVSWTGVPVLALCFTIAGCVLISLMCHGLIKDALHQFLLITVCVLLLNRFQLQTQGLPFCFKFPAQNVQGVHVRESQVLIKFFILCVFSFDILHCTFLFVCTQTSVFTPAFGSVTNVRVNSSMTTVQVLNLLLHKFRVSRNKTLVTDWVVFHGNFRPYNQPTLVYFKGGE